MKKQGIVHRIKSVFGGSIPVMPDINSIYSDGLSYNEYRNKDAQIKANTGWVYLASETIAERCASVKLKLYRNMPDGDKEEIYNHEILSLLNNPTATITAKQLWSLYYQYMNLTGETYILKLDRNGEPLTDISKLPSALVLLPSNKCDFKLGKVWSDSVVSFGAMNYPISAIIRDINPDPENIYHGMSVVKKASLTIDTDYEMKRWNNKLFKNGARPSLAVEVPTEMSDESYKRLKQSFDENYTGGENAFRSVILENGAKVSPFMMSQQDLDFLESKRFTRDEILAMFKVSPSNVGIVEDVNRANAEAQKAEFAERCIVPRLEQFCDVINQRLLYPIYGSEYELGYESPIPEDQERMLALANSGVNKWFSIDEIREMYGFEALPNGSGSEIYMPINQVPISELSIGSITPSEPAQEPSNSNEGTNTENGEEPTENGSEQELELKEVENEIDKRQEIGEAKVKAYTKRALVYEKIVRRTARNMFNKQKEETLKWLKEHAKADGNYTKKDWSDEILDWNSYKSRFQEELQLIFDMIIAEIGEDAFNALIAEGGFDPKSESIAKFIEKEALRASSEINDETQKQLRATLAQGMRDGEDIQKLQARVSDVFGTASTSRALLIAQTECALAMSYADEEAWTQTGVVEAKEWFTAEDSSVCGFCAEMDGKIVSLGENFYNLGDRVEYTDSKGHNHTMKLDYRPIGEPPIHPGCRCTLLPVLK